MFFTYFFGEITPFQFIRKEFFHEYRPDYRQYQSSAPGISIPILISVVFQQFYNIADSIIAGRFIGEQALAAVGASYPITMIFMAVAIGSSIGCTVVVSQLFGSKHYAMLKTAVGTICCAGVIVSIVLSLWHLAG